MNNHQNTILLANSGKAAKKQAEHQFGNFLKTPLALLGVYLKKFQLNKIYHFVYALGVLIIPIYAKTSNHE